MEQELKVRGNGRKEPIMEKMTSEQGVSRAWYIAAALVYALAILLMLAGCTPSTTIKQPLTARPAPSEPYVANNGAIFQAGHGERPLFEDRRARNVGDVLTINIVESTSASGKTSSGADHSGSFSMTTPGISGGKNNQVALAPFSATASSSGKLADKSNSSGSHAFSGTITVTVIEVLGNGNLLVGGEKEVVINQSNEYVRFSGVVNPATINGNNSVPSTQVADVHLEFKDATNIDTSAITSTLVKLFLSVLPF